MFKPQEFVSKAFTDAEASTEDASEYDAPVLLLILGPKSCSPTLAFTTSPIYEVKKLKPIVECQAVGANVSEAKRNHAPRANRSIMRQDSPSLTESSAGEKVPELTPLSETRS